MITIQNNYFKFEEDALLLPQLLYIFLFLVIQTVIHSPTFGLHRKSEGRRNARGKKKPHNDDTWWALFETFRGWVAKQQREVAFIGTYPKARNPS